MQFVSINGHTIHYKFLNPFPANGDHRTFVFINSVGTDFRIWDDIVNELQGYGNILLFDKRGHGLSDVVEETVDLHDYADDVIALLQYLSIGKIIPVGLSVGGMITQILANRIQEQIDRAIFCDTSHIIGTAAIWNSRLGAIREGGIAAISGGVMERWFSKKFREENAIRVAGYKNMLERMPVAGYIKTCEVIRDANLENYAKQIRLPSLCIVGSEDKSTTPAEVKELADLIEGAAYEVIEGAGHIPCVDSPGLLTKLILDFIN